MASNTYMALVYVMDLIGKVCVVLLSVVFTIRIFRTNVPRSNEQIWSVVMVLMAALGSSIPSSFVFQRDQDFHQHNPRVWWTITHKWVIPMLKRFRIVESSFASVGEVFYVWCCAHSFGILEERDRPSNLRFYGPKYCF